LRHDNRRRGSDRHGRGGCNGGQLWCREDLERHDVVHGLVLGQFTLGFESLGALVAFEWPFTGMHEHVVGEVVGTVEGFATVGTFVGPSVAVASLMAGHVAQEPERFTTFWARIRFLAGVDTLVNFDFTQTTETLETDRTFMFLLSSMGLGVTSQGR